MIKTIEDIQRLVLQGETNWQQYGRVGVKENNGLLLFNYLPAAQFADEWTPFECMSRGLIIDKNTGEIVARPFDKFFNWLQGGRKASGHIVTVTEKVDGSLGILYRQAGQYRIATRGSFGGPQAEWATGFLQQGHPFLDVPDNLTLLFEIVYPENRIVIDYGDTHDLVLLAARDRFTGEYLPFFPDLFELAEVNGFSLPQIYQFNRVEDILALTGKVEVEGWVVEFSDGSRWKIKGDRYLELHKLISGLSFKNTLLAVQNGTIQYLLDNLPDEYQDMVATWYMEISHTVVSLKLDVEQAFNNAPKTDRKTFAQWVLQNHKPLASYLFAAYDGKDITPLIYREAFTNHREEE